MDNFTPPPPQLSLDSCNLPQLLFRCLIIVFFSAILISCMETTEQPEHREYQNNQQLALVRNWFEAHKEELRINDYGINFRTESQELILPFFEKEPDWNKFHIYEWPDGRQVYEVNLANKEIVLTSEFTDNMPHADPKETVIQNILFVENKDNGRFDPVVARYYPADEYSVSGFDEISYNKIGAGWSGTVDIWTYDERYFVGFIIEDGQLTATKHPEGYDFDQNARKTVLNGENLDTTCRHVVTITTVVTIVSAGGGSHITYQDETSVHMVCSGGSLGNNHGSNGNTGTTYPFNPGGGGTWIPNGQTYTPPRVFRPDIQIDFRGISDCHEKIIKDLIGSTQSEFKRIFQKFNGNQPVPANYNVRFRYGDCGGGASACTDPRLENGFAIIRINQKVNENATDLSFARTILHETLHAYLLFEEQFPSNCDLDCLLKRYINKYGSSNYNPSHHNLFVETKFLNDIAIELRNFANASGYNVNALGDQFFKDMAWGGLQKTDLFKTLPISVQTRIQNRLGAEHYNKNYSGTLPKGIKACD